MTGRGLRAAMFALMVLIVAMGVGMLLAAAVH